MSKVKALLLAVSMVPFVMNAQNLVKNGDAESGYENWAEEKVQVVTENPHSGKNCFKNKVAAVLSAEAIPVDGSKAYKISAWYKSADDKKTNVYLGFQPLDANQKPIESQHVNVVAGTETELAEACTGKDTLIKIKDCGKWKINPDNSLIAFDVDITGELKDLPNRNISKGTVKKIEKKDAFWEVTLATPCGMDYPAGTKVRMHSHGASYTYMAYKAQFNSPEWQEFSAQVNGFDKGTKFIRIVVLALGGGNIFFDDVRFEEMK
ncbi:MAG: hypothetical protein WCI51_07725 [Lentisphaerota bacterium]